jgi:hypothetical protein
MENLINFRFLFLLKKFYFIDFLNKIKILSKNFKFKENRNEF